MSDHFQKEIAFLGIDSSPAFVRAAQRDRRSGRVALLCLAHVTNTMGQTEKDFEKGADDGTTDALKVLAAIVRGLPQFRLKAMST